MNELDPIFHQVDDFIESLYTQSDAALELALTDSAAAGLPEIHVSPNQGKLLYLLTKISGAKNILEIGLLGGYSTIWLARASGSNGRVTSLEISEKHAAVARKNIDRAGVGPQVRIEVGPALDTLKKLAASPDRAPFDFIFIDADKNNYPVYLDAAMQLVRAGSVIVGDNVIRNGKVLEDAKGDPDLIGLQEFNRRMAGDPRLDSIAVPLIRAKLDGIAIARVK